MASQTKPLDPFLRWAGGKRKILSVLVKLIPKDIASRKYYEPFAGAASLYFRLMPKKAVLADANEHLIDCYAYVRDNPDQVIRHLRIHARNTSKKYYYEVRDIYNSSKPSAAQAARFVYLNKTCFNGIFRVNTLGEFNVPYGHKEPPALPSSADIRSAGKLLKKASLKACDYRAVLRDVEKGAFVYLDPPYPPLNGTAYFTHYTADRFSENNQRQLAKAVRELNRRKCLFMLTNADTRCVKDLYKGFNIRRLLVRRYITCSNVKHCVRELVIRNYE